MRNHMTGCWVLFWVFVLAVAAWLLGLGETVRSSLTSGHLLDWVTGGLCLFWLLVILKVPWDLYFQAHTVDFEIQRSKERHVRTAEGREEYVRTLRRRLGWFAIAVHVVSAALVAGVTYFAHGVVGYYFAVFYLVSTLFRPAVAMYGYLSRKLSLIEEESRYPREDVLEMRERLHWQKERLETVSAQMEQYGEELHREITIREQEDREMRERLHAIGRELETTVSRLTDNQEVIKGIQAFVRLVTQSSTTP